MRGGKRIGAGRKPCTDKKQQLTIYVLTSQIEKLGKDTRNGQTGCQLYKPRKKDEQTN